SDRRTICISTQVGCAYCCKFCASGLDGWKRNLRADEIVNQIMAVEEATGERIDNIVFMGMGEPLANYDNLLRAIQIINAPWGIGIGARRVTVSTSGLVPQIRQLSDQPLQIRLAVSLHGASDDVRSLLKIVRRNFLTFCVRPAYVRPFAAKKAMTLPRPADNCACKQNAVWQRLFSSQVAKSIAPRCKLAFISSWPDSITSRNALGTNTIGSV